MMVYFTDIGLDGNYSWCFDDSGIYKLMNELPEQYEYNIRLYTINIIKEPVYDGDVLIEHGEITITLT